MSDSQPAAQLPTRPDLDQLRKQAKELRSSGAHPTLVSAQHALAREYGFPSWPKLKRAVDLITLRRLIEDGELAPVRQFLDASPSLVKLPFPEGDTPLHLAAAENRPELVELLVARGAMLHSTYGRSSHSALSWAITVGSFEAAHRLVELGHNPDLFCAAGLGLLDHVKAFWDGGRLRRRPSKSGSSRYSEAGERLPSPPTKDADHVSDALYIACRNDHLDVGRWLLDHGADPNWRGYAGATCLAWAEYSGDAALCALMREHGGSDEILDPEYQAPPRVFGVMVLAGWGFAKMLLDRLTADRSLISLRTICGTLLHAAAEGGQTPTSRILLHFGADKSARNADGRTPAELAEAKGHKELAELLR